MKKTLFSLLLLASAVAYGQELPAASPAASFKQRVGLTDVEVSYARPSMRGRKIFGGLVPYDALWRTGANQSTLITFSTSVVFCGVSLPAGKYSLMTIPSAKNWTIILNQSTDLWGIEGYSESNDVARIPVVPNRMDSSVETMTLEMGEITLDKAVLTMKWENTQVSMPLEVSTHEHAMNNIEKAIDEKPEDARVYRNAASYLNSVGKDNELALGFAERSVQLSPENWYSHYLYAQLLRKNGKEKEAVVAAELALKLGKEDSGKKDQPFSYEDNIKAFLKEKRN